MPLKMLEGVAQLLSPLKDKKSLRKYVVPQGFFIISFKHAQICYNRTRKLNKTEGYTLPLYVYIKEGYTLPLYVYIKEYYQPFTNFK